MKELLPVGPVVLLKDYFETIMIIGYKAQKKGSEDTKIYDYMAVEAPYGFSNDKEYILFNKEDIYTVLFVGYQSLEFDNYLNRLKKE